MQVVVEMPQSLSDARAAGLSVEARARIVDRIASDPTAGQIIPGAGGARKVRFPGRGRCAQGPVRRARQGQERGYRVITF